MVLFFMADMAFTLAFKIGAWCLGQTYNGIVYLIATSKSPPPRANDDAINDDNCIIVTMTRQEHDALKQLRKDTREIMQIQCLSDSDSDDNDDVSSSSS